MMVVSLSPPVVFVVVRCKMLPNMREPDFCVAFEVLVLLRVALGLVSGRTLGLVVSVAVAG